MWEKLRTKVLVSHFYFQYFILSLNCLKINRSNRIDDTTKLESDVAETSEEVC